MKKKADPERDIQEHIPLLGLAFMACVRLLVQLTWAAVGREECSWCHKVMKRPLLPWVKPTTSHGICPGCRLKHFPAVHEHAGSFLQASPAELLGVPVREAVDRRNQPSENL